jgi:hypothetical protein
VKILLAILIPPLAVLLCGRPILALVLGVLWLASVAASFVGVGIPFLIGITVAAVYVVVKHDNDKRADKLVAALSKSQAPR